MSIRLPPRRHRAATLLALLLVALRLAVPAYALSAGTRSEDAAAALGGVPICHADAGPAAPEPAGKPTLPSEHDCSFCPTCQLAAPALLPPASWGPAPLQASPAQAALPPLSTGPPHPERYAASPRGPPASAV